MKHSAIPPTLVEIKGMPTNIDAERFILGSILLDESKFDQVISRIGVDDFALEKHRRIFTRMGDLRARNERLDRLTLANELLRFNELEMVDGLTYIVSLDDGLPLISNLDSYARIVRDKSALRRLAVLSQHTMNRAILAEDSAELILGDTQREMTDLALTTMDDARALNLRGVLDRTQGGINAFLSSQARAFRMPSGYPALDDLMYGFQPKKMYVIAGDTSHGKCHGKGTRVLKFDGTVAKVEDLRVGDQLMGPDSNPRTISSLASGFDDLFLVQPKRGDSFICNSQHVLTLKRLRRFGSGRKTTTWGYDGLVDDISVSGYIGLNTTDRGRRRLFRTAVEFRPSATPTISPYFLGVLLGDDSIGRSIGVTTMDEEIVAEVQSQAAKYGMSIRIDRKPGNKANSYYLSCGAQITRNGFNDLRNQLHTYGLLGKTCGHKFIPHDYKVASTPDRLSLLAGLIDTYGAVNSQGYDLCLKSRSLIDDVTFLARSVGLSANTTNPRIVNGVTYYRIQIGGDCWRVPVRLPRKMLRNRGKRNDALLTGFTVKPLGRGQYFGFTLTEEPHYLLADFTVTHNSSLALNMVQFMATSGHPGLYFTVEMGREEMLQRMVCAEAKVSLWRLVKGYCDQQERSALSAATATLADLPLYLDDTANLTAADLVIQARRAKQKWGIKWMVVDYIQILDYMANSAKGGRPLSEYEGLTAFSRAFKMLAKTLDMSVIVLSQFSKNQERTAGKVRRPIISDMHGTGAMGKDADVVMFVWRPWLHTKRDEIRHHAELIVAKNRSGPLGFVNMVFNGDYTRFFQSEDQLQKQIA